MFALLISWLRSINDPKIPNLFGHNFCLHELQLLSSDTNSKPSSDASNIFKNMTLYWLWIVCWIIENLSTDTNSFIHCKIYTVNDKYVMKTEEKMDTNVDFIEMMSLYKYKRWCTTSSSQGLTQPPPKSHQMNISWCSVHMLVVRINKALSNKTKETKILTNLSAMQ